MTSGSRPNFSPAAKISEVATRIVAPSKLFNALTAWPDPTGPTCTTLVPIRLSNGSARAKSAASPPAMIASLPDSAPPIPPETGASIKVIPCCFEILAFSMVLAGVDELMSITIAPGFKVLSNSLRNTLSTIGLSGNIKITTSTSVIAAMLATAFPPAAWAACSRRATSRSNTCTSANPFKWPTMRPPIAPKPTNPTFTPAPAVF